MSIAKTWELLDSQAVQGSESRRRIFQESLADMWLVIAGVPKTRIFRVRITQPASFPDLPKGSGIDTQILKLEDNNFYLEVACTNSSFAEVFDVLVDDLSRAATNASNVEDVTDTVVDRVRLWQEFLKSRMEGLSKESLRGLFGELRVLELIGKEFGFVRAVNSWAGPAGFPQDFHLNALAIEVKTTASKNPQSVGIASERQLDDKNLESLVLWHFSVDERLDLGRTVPELVQKIRDEVPHAVRSLFEDRLLQVGYLDIHNHLYKVGFSDRKQTVFDVVQGFPRLVENDCPAGLGDLRYSIQFGSITAFEIDPRVVFGRVSNANN